jgi:predicted DNA-binding protein
MSGEQYPGQHDLQSALDKQLTYVEPTVDEAAAIAALPTEEQSLEQTFVTSSMRLPYSLHQALRAYAEARGTTVTTVLRQWIELHLTADDKPIRLEDAVRVLAALPRAA